jgi:hypothetical protein
MNEAGQTALSNGFGHLIFRIVPGKSRAIGAQK